MRKILIDRWDIHVQMLGYFLVRNRYRLVSQAYGFFFAVFFVEREYVEKQQMNDPNIKKIKEERSKMK